MNYQQSFGHVNQSINQSINRRKDTWIKRRNTLTGRREYDNIRPYQCRGDIACGVYDGRRLFAIIPHHGNVSSLGLSGDQGKLGEIHVEFLPPHLVQLKLSIVHVKSKRIPIIREICHFSPNKFFPWSTGSRGNESKKLVRSFPAKKTTTSNSKLKSEQI